MWSSDRESLSCWWERRWPGHPGQVPVSSSPQPPTALRPWVPLRWFSGPQEGPPGHSLRLASLLRRGLPAARKVGKVGGRGVTVRVVVEQSRIQT